MAKMFRIKPLAVILKEAGEKNNLKRTLTLYSIIGLGVGAIIGAGLFVRTAAAAGGHAGPAVSLSFVVAALGCLFAGLCYAEFASTLPLSGSAYTYSYFTMGEVVAWVIGWGLVLEYALGASMVAIGWSEYLNKLLEYFFNTEIPYQWSHSPLEHSPITGETGIVNLPAILILLLLTFVLIKGISQSAVVNNIIVIVKVCIILLFIILGWKYISADHLTPFFIPKDAGSLPLPDGSVYDYSGIWNHGILGMFRGAGIVFFAFIGFDAVSTVAQESVKPSRDVPRGILISLLICTVLYVLFSFVMTGTTDYKEFMVEGKEASVAYIISNYMHGLEWFSPLITMAILAGFSSVILVMLLGQTRIFYTISRDGLLPPVFSKLHKTYQTPYISQIWLFVFTSVLGGFVPGNIVGDMSSIGTLFAFVLVCIGVMIMRKKNPTLHRPFKTPYYKLVSILGILVCMSMIISLGKENWIRLFIWFVIGLAIYFGYGIKHSNLNKAKGMSQPKADANEQLK